MASAEGVKNEELNSVFKSLAERGKDGEIYKKYNDCFAGQRTPQFSSEPSKSEFENNHIMFWAYGSAAENLQCYDACDAGDMDFMVFSNLDELIIHEEMLEYLLENPLHVRIKGSNHPVLKSCLVKDTEYVATSALKNFHPAIFGSMSPLMVDLLSFVCQLSSVDELPYHFTANLINKATSPAVSLSMSHLLGTISRYREMLEVDSLNVPINKAAAEAECFIHFYCTSRGIVYSLEHAHLLNDFLLFIRDIFKLLSNFTFCFFIPEIEDRYGNLLGRLGDMKSRSVSMFETEHTKDQHIFTLFNRKDSFRDEVQYSGETSPSKHITGTTDAPQNCVFERTSPEDLEFTSSQSKMQRVSSESCHQPSKRSVPKEVAESKCAEGNITDAKRGKDYCEHKNERPGNPLSQDEKDKKELERRFQRFFTIMLKTIAEETETEYTDIGRVTSGADFIPSFRSRAWPKVAEEWVHRERKWPSLDTVDKVIKEGCHLVVKSAKNGSPECDFRISFSNAEYLLSQEMNEIQKQCYRCLKRYRRAYLCTEPKRLVSFHLKNIFLQTIEKTGAEMWTECNRADCMMKLLRNLLAALTKKDLPHFFVRSYNLFGVDYIENPEILESLARKVEEIMENPARLAKQLMQNQEETNHVKEEKCVSKKNIPSSESSLSRKPAASQGHGEIEESPSEGRCDTQCRKEIVTLPLRPTETTPGCCPVYRYHDLHDKYEEVTKQLVNAVIDADCRIKAINPLETSLVKDLRELVSEYRIPVSVFPRVLDAFWHKIAYYWVWISNEPDMRHRILVAIQGLVELLKYHLKKDDCWQADNADALEALIDRTLDASTEHPLELSHVFPSSNFIHFMHEVAKMLEKLNPSQYESETSFVENLIEVLTTFLDLSSHSGEIHYLVENFICFTGLTGNEQRDVLVVFQDLGLLELAKQYMLKKEDDQRGESDERSKDLLERLFYIINSFINIFISSSAQPNEACNTDDIPLD